ncbi:DNA-binding XRE family transcriptional regulator [Pseudacidovorax sp. 1753]|uniref:helix-turn-helix domain-containing protein n=1 Tax=Pseudacidovorax sp. 1753 TaxID=3156419 RepID=UPI003392EBB7
MLTHQGYRQLLPLRRGKRRRTKVFGHVEYLPWSNITQDRTIVSMPMVSRKYALDPALVALGNAIRSLRLQRGISQEDLAHRSGLDRSYMSGIERGVQNPGVMNVIHIAAGLGISMEELMATAKL